MAADEVNHPLGAPRYYAVLNYGYSYKGCLDLDKEQLRQRWDINCIKKNTLFINGLIRKSFGSDIPIWWTIERHKDYQDECGNTKKGMFHSNLYIGEIDDCAIEEPSSALIPLFNAEDDVGIPINLRALDLEQLKVLLLGACIRQAKWVGNNPKSLFISDVPPDEMERTFMYGLKDFNSDLNQLNTIIDWSNSSFYKP